jgi:hypothetical protein
MVTFVKDGREVTRMGFYSELFGNFSIPPSWKKFNGVLLPDGFGGLHLKPENIIKWSKIIISMKRKSKTT